MSQIVQLSILRLNKVCIAVLSIAVMLSCMAAGSELSAQDQTGPTKKALIKDLKAIFPLLEKKQFVAAAEYVNSPEGFKPEMLDGLVERQEISMEGILRLERDGKFGKANDVFGKVRAESFVKRHGVDVNQCYGFNHQANDVTAEVIGFWNGTRFKLVRIDDVGKLAGLDAAKKSAAPPNSKTLAEAIAEQKAIKEAMVAMIPGLTAAIEADPNNVEARLKYAMILLKLRIRPEPGSKFESPQRSIQNSRVLRSESIWRS